MRNFIRFLTRNYFFFMFLFFQAICFYLLFNYNYQHKKIFVNSSTWITASFLEVADVFNDYLSLRRANDELARENAYLRSRLNENIKLPGSVLNFREEPGTILNYRYRAAEVVNNSVNRVNNFITINKGRNDGIAAGMGVISSRGVVGVVRHVSANYATAISLLSHQFNVSAKLRESDFFGVLAWDGLSYQHAILTEIPAHAPLELGEAVVSSGFSVIFPEGVLLGTVESYELNEGEGFFTIKVKLSVDFKNLTHVEVVEKVTANEVLQLERLMENE